MLPLILALNALRMSCSSPLKPMELQTSLEHFSLEIDFHCVQHGRPLPPSNVTRGPVIAVNYPRDVTIRADSASLFRVRPKGDVLVGLFGWCVRSGRFAIN